MPVDWELDNIGIVVRNMDEAIKHYSRLGLEPLLQPETKTLETAGGPASCKMCFVQNYAVRFMLIQPAESGDLFGKYLERHGEGVFHLQFYVKDLQKEKTGLINKDIGILAQTKKPDGSDLEVFFDTRKHGNVSISLYGNPAPTAPFPVFQPSPGDWKFWHVGFVITDIKNFADYYELIGFKPTIKPVLRQPGPDITKWWTFYKKGSPYGRPVQGPVTSWECKLQNEQKSIYIDGRQPVEGNETHFQQFLDTHGDGLEHIHFLVNDVHKELANMVANGFSVIQTQRRPNGVIRDTFYDTREVGNVIIDLMNKHAEAL